LFYYIFTLTKLDKASNTHAICVLFSIQCYQMSSMYELLVCKKVASNM